MSWRNEYRRNITNSVQLVERGFISKTEKKKLDIVIEQYPMNITEYYLNLADSGNEAVRKMCMPNYHEVHCSGDADTSGETENTALPGLQHKYFTTAMVLSTKVCAMYCRHCFRKRLVGKHDMEILRDVKEARDYILEHPEINNVLVSGGDALMNSNERIKELLEAFVDIKSVKAIRIASRIPVVFPNRVLLDEELQKILGHYAGLKQLYLVTQFNHPGELTEDAVAVIKKLTTLGIVVYNQTVLLKGINDDAGIMAELLDRLVASGAVNYYIFQCRPTKGVKNEFQVPLLKGCDIIREARNRQNGLGKTFHFCMSHVTGKIEIIDKVNGNELLLRYHEAKNRENLGRIFTVKADDGLTWLEGKSY